jgi:hypothetical protein
LQFGNPTVLLGGKWALMYQEMPPNLEEYHDRFDSYTNQNMNEIEEIG